MKTLADVAKHIHSMSEFAEACKGLSNVQICTLFDDEISPDLRDEIYHTFWSRSRWPTRAALHQLGERYDIPSLQRY